jgi:hypothetical protein
LGAALFVLGARVEVNSIDPLSSEPFDYQETKDGKVLLFHKGKHIETLTGTAALRFLARASNVDSRGVQLLMAKATKNFKRGNERSGST